MENKKGQMDGMGGRVLTVIFGIILIVAVAIPITNDILNQTQTIEQNISGNLTNVTTNVITGTTATVIGFIPLFLGLAGLALAAALVS